MRSNVLSALRSDLELLLASSNPGLQAAARKTLGGMTAFFVSLGSLLVVPF